MTPPTFRAGQTVEDLCRACKVDRQHTIIVATPDGVRPLRVQCDYCASQHAYRGGGSDTPREAYTASRDVASSRGQTRPMASRASEPAAPRDYDPFPLVGAREVADPALIVEVPMHGPVELESLLRRIIREETGLTPVAPADRWRGGTLAIRPANASLQEKTWPIETFFHKIVMMRNRLRTLEQQINALSIDDDQKVKIQSYITGCYGSLTSFNVLFADEDDHFKGSGD
ncbi:MAG: hypothetical protein ABIT71_25360 [Vicinamibacteraceae bacterium]